MDTTPQANDLVKAVNELIALFRAESAPLSPFKNRTESGSIYPYFKEKYARQIIPVLDAILEDSNDRMIYWSDYPGLTKRSLYLRILQSFDFARTYMDPDGKYERLRDTIVISKEVKGIRLSLKPKIDYGIEAEGPLKSSIVPKEITQQEVKRVDWRNNLMEFIAKDSPGKAFVEQGLHLSQDDISWVEDMVAQAGENFLGAVDKNKIKVIRKP